MANGDMMDMRGGMHADMEDQGQEQDDTGEANKLTQEEANYRAGSPVKHCGICQWYEGGDQCSKVQSPISAYGVSDVYQASPNPFGSKLGPRETAMINSMMNSPPDQSSAVQGQQAPPRTQIGSKVY